MNAVSERPLPFGADLYRDLYIKTGIVPNKNEIRLFMALVEVAQDDKCLQLVHEGVKAPGRAPFKGFSEKVMACYQARWKDRTVSSHSEICAGIRLYEKSIIAAEAKERQEKTRFIGKGTQRQDVVPQNSAAPSKVETRDKLAALAGMSHDTYDRCAYIDKHGTPEQT